MSPALTEKVASLNIGCPLAFEQHTPLTSNIVSAIMNRWLYVRAIIPWS